MGSPADPAWGDPPPCPVDSLDDLSKAADHWQAVWAEGVSEAFVLPPAAGADPACPPLSASPGEVMGLSVRGLRRVLAAYSARKAIGPDRIEVAFLKALPDEVLLVFVILLRQIQRVRRWPARCCKSGWP